MQHVQIFVCLKNITAEQVSMHTVCMIITLCACSRFKHKPRHTSHCRRHEQAQFAIAGFVYSMCKYADRTCKSSSLHMVGTIG